MRYCWSKKIKKNTNLSNSELIFRNIFLSIFMLLISLDSLIICLFINIFYILVSGSKINNSSLVGVLQNGPKPQLSNLKRPRNNSYKGEMIPYKIHCWQIQRLSMVSGIFKKLRTSHFYPDINRHYTCFHIMPR